LAKAAITSNKDTAPTNANSPAWITTLGELDLNDLRVDLEDRVPVPTVKSSLESISMRIFPPQDAQSPHVLEGKLAISTGGSLAFKGSFNEQPLSVTAEMNLQELSLPPLAPYATEYARFALESGVLDTRGKFTFKQGKQTQANSPVRWQFANLQPMILIKMSVFWRGKPLVLKGLNGRWSRGN
jgi:hypothetical protein